MKTNILDELEIPEPCRAALSREAFRRGVPVNVLLREFLLEKSEQVISASRPESRKQAA